MVALFPFLPTGAHKGRPYILQAFPAFAPSRHSRAGGNPGPQRRYGESVKGAQPCARFPALHTEGEGTARQWRTLPIVAPVCANL